MHHHKHHHKKKEYSKTEKVIYHTSKFLGETGRTIKEGLKKGYEAASNPKVNKAFKETRKAYAEELNENPQEQINEELKLKRENQILRAELSKSNLRETVIRKPKVFKEPFSRVVREQVPNNSLQLGWGGF